MKVNSVVDITRLVPKSAHAEGKLAGLALDEWWLVHRILLPTRTQPKKIVWLTRDEQVAVHFVEDPMVDLDYIIVEGKSEEREKVARLIREKLDIYDDEDIAELIENAQTPNERISAVQHAALAAPLEFDETYFKYVTDALADPNPEVRRAALTTTAYVAWRQLKEPMEKVSQSDPDPAIREFAAFGIRSLEKHNWEERT